jgi:hypothetical protein
MSYEPSATPSVDSIRVHAPGYSLDYDPIILAGSFKHSRPNYGGKVPMITAGVYVLDRGENWCEIQVGHSSMLFSYRKLVGVRDSNGHVYRCEQGPARTTERHLALREYHKGKVRNELMLQSLAIRAIGG